MSRTSFLCGVDKKEDGIVDSQAILNYAPFPAGGEPGGDLEPSDLDLFWAETRAGVVRRAIAKEAQNVKELQLKTLKTSKSGLNLLVTSKLKKKAQITKEKQKKLRKLVIHPQSHLKMLWDMFIGLLIVYGIIIIPWRISFNQEAKGVLFWVEIMFDFSFFIDIALSFFTGYFVDDTLITEHKMIAAKYLRCWFSIDLLSTIPFNLLIPIILEGQEGEGIVGFKLLRVIRLVRLLKLMRVLRLSRKLRSIDVARYINPSIVRLLQLLARILSVAHLIACLWFMVDGCTVEPDRPGEDTWKECGGESLQSKYLASFYWTIATLMSVGYGDISANTDRERLYALVTEVIGATAFGFIIAMVTVIVETMDPQATALNQKMDEIQEYMNEWGLPKALQRRIRAHFVYYYSYKSVFNEIQILRDLPHSLRVKLAYDSHREVISKLHLLEDLDAMAITEIVYRLKPCELGLNEYVAKKGEVLEEFFIVQKGKIEATTQAPHSRLVLVAVHNDGSDFELSSLLHSLSCKFNYRAATASTLLWLSGSDLSSIMVQHGSADRRLLSRCSHQLVLLAAVMQSDDLEYGGKMVKRGLLIDWQQPGLLMMQRELARIGGSGDTSSPPIAQRTRRHSSVALLSPVAAEEDMSGKVMVRTLRVRSAFKQTSTVRAQSGEVAPSAHLREKDSQQMKAMQPVIAFLRSIFSKHPGTVEALECPDVMLRRGIVLPSSLAKIKWDVYIGVLVALSLIIVPFRIGFHTEPGPVALVIDLLVDISFFFDILLSFRTAYLDNANVFVTVPSMIARKYALSWLSIDLLSTIPFDRIIELTALGRSELRTLKMVRALKLARIMRLIRLLKVVTFNGSLEEMVELNAVYFRGLKLLVTLGFLGHLFGCFWSVVSVPGLDGNGITWWGTGLGLEEHQIGQRYVASIYWAFTTMTTVGYGDIRPHVDSERFYATVIMVIGATVFGYIVGSVSSLASNPNGSQALETEKILAVSNYLDEKKVQENTKKAVNKHLEYFLTKRSAFDDGAILNLMPPQLRTETVLQGHRDIIAKTSLFQGQDNNIIAFVVRQMVPQFCIAGHMIYEADQGSGGIYFMLSGMAEAVRPLPGDAGFEVLHTVHAGHLFGHAGFIGSEESPTGTRAVTDCRMNVLQAPVITDMLESQPDMASRLQSAIQNAILEQEKATLEAEAAEADKSEPGSERAKRQGLTDYLGNMRTIHRKAAVIPVG